MQRNLSPWPSHAKSRFSPCFPPIIARDTGASGSIPIQARAQNRTVKAMERDRGCFVDNAVARDCAVVVGCLTADVHLVPLRSSPRVRTENSSQTITVPISGTAGSMGCPVRLGADAGPI